MRKMGWKTGEGLGRNREGTVEPIIIDFKVDRKGLKPQNTWLAAYFDLILNMMPCMERKGSQVTKQTWINVTGELTVLDHCNIAWSKSTPASVVLDGWPRHSQALSDPYFYDAMLQQSSPLTICTCFKSSSTSNWRVFFNECTVRE